MIENGSALVQVDEMTNDVIHFINPETRNSYFYFWHSPYKFAYIPKEIIEIAFNQVAEIPIKLKLREFNINSPNNW
jgi:hypothetical protein